MKNLIRKLAGRKGKEEITIDKIWASMDRIENENRQRKQQAEDVLYQRAVQVVLEARNARNTFLRYKLKIGRWRATKFIERMTDEGVLGPHKGGNIPREILKE